MNAKKKRTKNRRRARKLADQAWEAADEGHSHLAIKIIRRAVDLDPGNPVFWNDQGLLLRQFGDAAKAADSLQAAISLAPDFADAYAHLAEIRLHQGLLREAVALQQQAVSHAPQSAKYRDSLIAYQALVGRVGADEQQPHDMSEVDEALLSCPIEQSRRQEYPEMATSVDELDWSLLEHALTTQGYCAIPGLLSVETCRELRQMFHDDSLFDKTVVMNKDRFGAGTYRYFSAPIPTLVDAVRRIVFPHVAKIANRWQRMLGEDEFFPTVWEGFRHRCAEFGQTTPTPLLLRYEAGGFNDLHRDIRGEVFFPTQMAIVLSPKVDSTIGNKHGFQGGNFLFCDDPVRKKSDRRAVPAGLGDVVLFCTRARLVRIAGVYGWQPVKHGVDRIESGTRYVLGVPFHEYQ